RSVGRDSALLAGVRGPGHRSALRQCWVVQHASRWHVDGKRTASIPGIGKGGRRIVPLGRGRGPGTMRTRAKRGQKESDDLPPSVIFTRYPPKRLRLPGGPRISQGYHPSGELRQRMEVEEVREIVGSEPPPPAAAAAPRAHSGGT